NIEYYTAIFKPGTIARLAGHFKRLIKQVVENPGIRLEDIDILTQRERQQLLYQFNDTQTDYPGETGIGELFERQVEKIPHHTAVVSGAEQVTYKVLDQQSNRLANYLYHENATGSGQPVGILMHRGISMIIAILGIVKARGVYVPLLPSLPGERIIYMIYDCNIKYLIGEKFHIKTLNRLQWECPNLGTFLCIDSEDVLDEEERQENQLMSRKLWEFVGETSHDEISGGG
ncbi:MAG: AMP-binding protein, partial [bacterium]|nr:AMP-binding protein [bacterium]